MKNLFCLLILLFACSSLSAQKYISAFGVQGGNGEIGLTFQQRILEKSTIEGLLTFSGSHVTLHGLYEFHEPIITKGLNFYVGAGPHVGTLKENGPFWGISTMAGVEFKFPVMPLVISGSIRPEFHLGHPKSIEIQGGFSVKYVIISNRDRRKKQRKKRKNRAYESGKIRFKKKK